MSLSKRIEWILLFNQIYTILGHTLFNSIRRVWTHCKKEKENEEIYLGKLTDVKFSYFNIFFAMSKIKFVIEVENIIEKALKNLTEKHEINLKKMLSREINPEDS